MKKQYLKTKPVCKVTFSLPAEATDGADSVLVMGDFNEWNTENATPLIRQKDGSFRLVLDLPAGQDYEFRYLIDNERWENDWEADGYVPSPYFGIDNSVVSLDAVTIAPKKKATPKKKAVAKAKAAPKKAVAKKKATPKKADDLKKIEGVGPKIAGLLNEAGISTFKKLARAKPAKLEGILEKAGPRYRMHKPATWPEQAALAAAGKWDELKVLQDELQGGKR